MKKIKPKCLEGMRFRFSKEFEKNKKKLKSLESLVKENGGTIDQTPYSESIHVKSCDYYIGHSQYVARKQTIRIGKFEYSVMNEKSLKEFIDKIKKINFINNLSSEEKNGQPTP